MMLHYRQNCLTPFAKLTVTSIRS